MNVLIHRDEEFCAKQCRGLGFVTTECTTFDVSLEFDHDFNFTPSPLCQAIWTKGEPKNAESEITIMGDSTVVSVAASIVQSESHPGKLSIRSFAGNDIRDILTENFDSGDDVFIIRAGEYERLVRLSEPILGITDGLGDDSDCELRHEAQCDAVWAKGTPAGEDEDDESEE